MRVEASIDLPVPPGAAWDMLTRWEDQARWMRDADRVDVLTAHREGLGVRVAVRTRVYGVPAFTEVLEVTMWDPPARLEIAHGGFVRGRGTWTFEGDATGTTFTWVEDLSLAVPVLGEVALLVYRPFQRWLMRGALAGLRRYVIAS